MSQTRYRTFLQTQLRAKYKSAQSCREQSSHEDPYRLHPLVEQKHFCHTLTRGTWQDVLPPNHHIQLWNKFWICCDLRGNHWPLRRSRKWGPHFEWVQNSVSTRTQSMTWCQSNRFYHQSFHGPKSFRLIMSYINDCFRSYSGSKVYRQNDQNKEGVPIHRLCLDGQERHLASIKISIGWDCLYTHISWPWWAASRIGFSWLLLPCQW